VEEEGEEEEKEEEEDACCRRHLISFSLRTVDHTLCDEPRNNEHENDYV